MFLGSRLPFWGATVAAALAACGGGPPTEAPSSASAADAGRGAELFGANCAACHGPAAQGTDEGPPLVHDYYVPSHHADEAFHLAVTRGVQPHHWDFGPMPPIADLERDEVDDIVAHVRRLQREAGLSR